MRVVSGSSRSSSGPKPAPSSEPPPPVANAQKTHGRSAMARTSTRYAPWNFIAANDKRHARLEVLRTIAEQLEARLGAKDDQAVLNQGNSKKTKKRKMS